MKFLDPQQVYCWYQNSLQYSGYREINSWCLNMWRTLAEQGNCAFPPGLIAKLLEKLTHTTLGIRTPKDQNLEDKLVLLIASGRGFTQLEGKFLIAKQQELDPIKCLAIIKRINEKLGNFYHKDILFSSNDVDQAILLSSTEEHSFSKILTHMYKQAISYMIKNGTSIDENDIFEIMHPHLFVSPTARSLFHKMVYTQKQLRDNVAGEMTPIKEHDSVTTVFGEPQSLPLGGYDSITTKGDLGSLVPSELAYIDESEKIDYFDYKYMHNELMYFKREEGIVFRIRRHIHLVLELDYEMEHERNLADLFAFSLVFCEKIFQTFIKDIVFVNVYFQGYLPSEIQSAISFLQHYLQEGNYDNKVTIYKGTQIQSLSQEEKRYQNWYIGDTNINVKMDKKINFVFPKLADTNAEKRCFLLADIIDELLEKITRISYF